MLRIWTGAKTHNVKKAILDYINADSVGGYKVYSLEETPVLRAGDLCLVCGAKGVLKLQEKGIVPKNRKVESLRGSVIPTLEGKAAFVVTYDPGILAMDTTKKPQMEWDVALACRWLYTGAVTPDTGDYKYVTDFTSAINFINTKYEAVNRRIPVSLDLETVGLDPYAEGVFIVSITVTYRAGSSDVIRFKTKKGGIAYRTPEGKIVVTDKALREQVRFLLSSEKVALRGANLKFDFGWIKHHWGIATFTSFVFDTTLVGSLLDENRSNSLNTHTKVYIPTLGGYDDEFNAKYDKSRMDLIPSRDFLQYAGGDTDACYRVTAKMRKELAQDRRLSAFYTKLLHPASVAVAKMERRGIILNVAEYDKLQVEVEAEIKRLRKEIFAIIPAVIKRRYSDNLSLTRDCIIRDFLFTKEGMNLPVMLRTEKAQEPSTAMEHLEMLAAHYEKVRPFVKLRGELNSAEKTLSTYIIGFRNHIRSDGRFHPTYMLHRGDYGGDESGTVSGRSSAKDPAFQTIPKHTIWAKPLRRVYTAPKGHVIVIFDYSQGELRIAACIADEPVMINAYRKGIDLHAITASVMCGMTFQEFMAQPEAWRDEMRSGGKAGNFGLLYGMGWRGFVEYARKTYGVYLEDYEGQAFREGFFTKYPKLTTWHNTVKGMAHKHEMVRSPLGRIRHAPLINSADKGIVARSERQVINFGPQSTLSDLGLYAMGQLDKMYPELWIWGFTHDALAFYIPEDEVDIWCPRIRDVMENLPYEQELGWKPQLQFLVDAELSTTNWAEAKKYKF